MEPPKLAILSLMSKFYLISGLVWMQVVVHMFENLYEWGEAATTRKFHSKKPAATAASAAPKVPKSVSSQTMMVTRWRTNTDELQKQIRTLENDKESLMKDINKLNEQLRKMEEKMHGVQDLNQIVEDHNNTLQTQFNEAHSNLDQLSEKAELKSKSEGQVPLNEDNMLLNDIKSEKELTNGLVEDDAKDKELKIAGTVEDDVTSDNKLEATGSPFANEPNVTRSLENDAKSVDKT
ncbi:hypothetical protein JHK85_048437 [Glycine max]|nr:hypothetical protein JHK86_047822 [Glycine max]KAG4943791.1 hypothetical protein JHK85_048437 [Glycine max]